MKKTVLILFAIVFSTAVFAEDISIVTINAWPGLEEKGFLNCGEIETAEVRLFRQEVLTTGLAKLEADIISLNGINPAPAMAGEAAEALGMSADAWISKSGFRIGPVGLPMNLKTGDAILAREDLAAQFAGRKVLGGGISNRTFTLFSRRGTQIISSMVNIAGREVWIFTAEWSESIFSDRESLDFLLDSYLAGDLEPELYAEAVKDAVDGAALRLTQAEETLAFINSTAGEAPVVLCGSLNALPGSSEMKLLESAGFTDVYAAAGRGSGNTLDPKRNTNLSKIKGPLPAAGYRTDYILIRGEGLKALSAELVFDEPVYGVYPSSRFGVKAVVRLSESPSEQ